MSKRKEALKMRPKTFKLNKKEIRTNKQRSLEYVTKVIQELTHIQHYYIFQNI